MVNRLFVALRDLHGGKGAIFLEMRLHPLQRLLLRSALGAARPAPLFFLDPLKPFLDEVEIGDDQLGLEFAQISERINAAFRLRHRRIGEGAEDGDNSVGLTQFLQKLSPEPGRAGRRRAGVHNLDCGARLLARLEHLDERIDSGIRYFHHGDPVICGVARGRIFRLPGESVEER